MPERYPGMKALATRVFTECPRVEHGSLTRDLKYYLDTAKARGIATTMDWSTQDLQTLRALFGAPPSTNHNREAKRPRATDGVKKESNKRTKAAPSGPPKTVKQLREERFQSKAPQDRPYNDTQIIGTIRGTSTELEKSYYRLTGQVNPAVVRPPEVLEKALPYVLGQFRKGKGYGYLLSQLQSIRQDLTVQHVETALTIEVYEVSARSALFEDDLGEFNKCLTRLQDLYKQCAEATHNKQEFDAYANYYTLLSHEYDELSTVLQTMDTNRLFDYEETENLGTENTGTESTETESTFKSGSTWPKTALQQSAMLDRSLMTIHHVQQEDLFGLARDCRSAWPLERRLLGRVLRRSQARALEGILTATSRQNQVLPLEFIKSVLGFRSLGELRAVLTEWAVPFAGKSITSAEALPRARAVKAALESFDIKGQI